MKAPVIRVFQDKNSNEIFQVGDIYEGTLDRIKELKGFVLASSDARQPKKETVEEATIDAPVEKAVKKKTIKKRGE